MKRTLILLATAAVVLPIAIYTGIRTAPALGAWVAVLATLMVAVPMAGVLAILEWTRKPRPGAFSPWAQDGSSGELPPDVLDKLCQSCALRLDDEAERGSERDGSVAASYCMHCYREGRFTEPLMTPEVMTAKLAQRLEAGGLPEGTLGPTTETIPRLKRWKSRCRLTIFLDFAPIFVVVFAIKLLFWGSIIGFSETPKLTTALMVMAPILIAAAILFAWVRRGVRFRRTARLIQAMSEASEE